MIISSANYSPEVDIEVSLYPHGATTEPFIVRLAFGTTVHMSLAEVERLHLELTAAMYDYDNGYKYKETA